MFSKNLLEKGNVFFTVLSWCEVRVPSQALVPLFKEAEYGIEEHDIVGLPRSI